MKKGVDYTGVCVVFHCHDGQGNVLMHKRSYKCRDEFGCWDIGGGGFEFGEQVLEAVSREIFEEYGVSPLEIEHLGYRDVHREYDGKQTHWVALDFKIRIDPVQVINGELDKIEELGWFTLSELPSPIHSQLHTFFNNYKHKL